ncbi:aldehyde dehydrogenase (NAD+) [Chitinivorax tropicus]|uniref:Aldehyde dehydrogenase (NAD+) n=1 Tax=Chitinivorax tropicus TaxID=714531 RepID=A0A840MRU9_9PROT|nr:aldehyde dehydrogenase family protein [Chitinivorax tropicus]MBB5019809.1 aldehyde dehydrogenase (NAD+) [Chitinivorax tropicus]
MGNSLPSLTETNTLMTPTGTSRFLNSKQLSALNRVGDRLCPGGLGMPNFSASGVGSEFDRVAHGMHPQDLRDLKQLLSLLYWLPDTLLDRLLKLGHRASLGTHPQLGLLRQLDVGLAGLCYSLYYGMTHPISGPLIREAIQWDAAISTELPGDNDMTELIDLANPLKAAQASNLVTDAYRRARTAQRSIRALSVRERLAYIARLKTILLERREDIVQQVVKESGKCKFDALVGEIFTVCDGLDFLLKNAEKLLADEKVPTSISMMGKHSRICYEPLGTVLVVAPWNYPFTQAMDPIAISFVTGNATLFKPSELTPLTGLIESLLLQAGFQPDWVQVVYGDGQVGNQLVEGKPDKIFFTGSVSTGRKIAVKAAAQLTPVELELGGKDPMLVFEDADLERSVAGALWGGLTNSGQSCTSVERLYIHDRIYDQFKAKLVERAMQIRVGTEAGDDMGPMISDRQTAIVRELVEDAERHGAKRLTGNQWDGQSRSIPPIILEGTTHAMRINQEEIFGPVIPIFRFKDEQEAIALANDSSFGLSASVWSKDLARAERVARALITGNVSINNVMVTEGNHHLPFGGTRDSGIGRFKGRYGLHQFCNMKSVMQEKMSSKIEANWYPYTPTKYRLFEQLTTGLYSQGLLNLIRFAKAGLGIESLAAKLWRHPDQR